MEVDRGVKKADLAADQGAEQKNLSADALEVPDLSPLVELAFKRADALGSKKETKSEEQKDQKERPVSAEAAPHLEAMTRRLGYLQTTLSNLVPAVIQDNSLTIFKERGAESPDNKDNQSRKVKEALAQEMRQGFFGPVTKNVYQSYVSWLEEKAIPRELARQKLYGMPLYPSDSFAVDGKTGKVSMRVDTDHAPYDRDIKSLNGAIDWLSANQQATDKKEEEIEKLIAAQVNTSVKELGLPRGWVRDQAQESENDKWLENSTRLTGLALRAGDYIELAEDLKKATGGKFPQDLPPNTQLERDEKGKVTRIHLDLPGSWKLDTPSDQAKLAALEEWVSARGALLEPIKSQLATLKARPELSLSKDDLEVPDGNVQLDANGKVAGFLGGTRYNLSSSDVLVEKNGDNIKVNQSVQLKNVPVWGYLNMVGVTDVGQPIYVERQFKPDDFVVVRRGHEYDLVQAKELSSSGAFDTLRHAGEKVLPAAMDVGMTGLGVLDMLGAARGRNPEALWQTGRGLLRTVAGGTGVFNNAGARETTWGADLNTARSAYFLTDITYGMTRSAAKAVGNRMLAQKAAAGDAQAAELLAQRAIKKLPMGIEAGTTRQKLYTAGGATLYGAAVGYTPYVYSDLLTQTIRSWNDPTKIIKKQAERQ